MLWKSKWVFLIGIVGLTVYSGTVLATPGSGVTITTLGRATFDAIHVTNSGEAKVKIKTKGDVDVIEASGTIAPGGGYTGWHTHPGPTLVVVTAGTLTYYDGDDPTCTPLVAGAGDGFVDSGGGHVHYVRNEGAVPADFLATQIVPVGETMTRIDVPAPGNCPF